MASRAIHLELAQSLKTDDVIMALRRFLNIWGNVKQLRSDNGSNFVGAERELLEALEGWNQNRIERHLRQSAVDWIFHPPYASHMSGETNSWRQAIVESYFRTRFSKGRGIKDGVSGSSRNS